MKVLALAGGGVRGVFQARFLQNLEQETKMSASEQFDMIAGTSTGSIVALAVASGVPAGKVLSLYSNESKNIFSQRALGSLRKGGRYNPMVLRKELDKLFGDMRLGDVKVEIVVPASVSDSLKGFVFTRESTPEYRLVDVALASASAPTYFRPARVDGSELTFVDGGLWANDPTLLAISTANQYLNVPLSEIRVLAIGTGFEARGYSRSQVDRMRFASLGTINYILEFVMRSQAWFSQTRSSELLSPGSILHVDPVLPTRIPLDDSARALEVLPGLADIEYKEWRVRIRRRLAEWDDEIGARLAASEESEIHSASGDHDRKPVVYWCAPHGDPVNAQMKSDLERHGCTVLLPDELAAGLPSTDSISRAKSIRDVCCEAIKRADFILVNVSTYGLDSAWEMGFAEGIKKQIIGYDVAGGLMPIKRTVNKRLYRDNFMHGWDEAYISEDLEEIARKCKGKKVYLFCPYANTEAIERVRKTVGPLAADLILSNERLNLDAQESVGYSDANRNRALQFAQQSDIILTVLPRYGMDTAWKLGYVNAHSKTVIGWLASEFGENDSLADFTDHWMHGWRRKLVASQMSQLVAIIHGYSRRLCHRED